MPTPRPSHALPHIRSGAALLALVLLLMPIGAMAQCREADRTIVEAPAGVVQELTLAGGGTLFGRVLEAGDPVRFELISGDVMEVRPDRIRCLRTVEGELREGDFWPVDPNTTRLFFGPTARSLAQGQGYVSVFELFFPLVALGATDRLTLAAGMPLFFTSEGVELFWVAPKLEVVRTAGFRAAAGVLAFLSPGAGENAGVLYGVGTFGSSSDAALTVGAGWGYDSVDGIHDSPAVMGGFEYRVARGVKLLSENYFFPAEDFAVVSFGPRFFGRRLSADLGLAMPLGAGMDGFFTFPLVNFVWNF